MPADSHQIAVSVHRKRNFWLTEAHKATEIESLDYRNAFGQWDELKTDAAQYQTEVHDKTLILENEETGELLKIPYVTRFSEAYIKRTMKKLRRVAGRFSTAQAFFWTFTLDPSRFHSLKDMHDGLSRYWNKLLTAIKKHYHAQILYIKIVESQKSGMLHIHVVFNIWIDINFIRELWARVYGAGVEVNVQRVYDHAGVAHYLFKYLSKTLEDDIEVSNEPNLTKVILWALYARSFSYARLLDNGSNNSNRYRRLLSPSLMPEEEETHWVYLGAVPNSVAEMSDADILNFFAEKYAEKDLS